MPRQDFTLNDTEQLGDALIPRFQQAIAPEFTTIRNELQQIREELTTLKARSGLWGATGGAAMALAAILTELAAGGRR